jgi:hypothetical protein
MDYGMPEKRKSKNDWKAKSRFNKYKKGGKNRAASISIVNKK